MSFVEIEQGLVNLDHIFYINTTTAYDTAKRKVFYYVRISPVTHIFDKIEFLHMSYTDYTTLYPKLKQHMVHIGKFLVNYNIITVISQKLVEDKHEYVVYFNTTVDGYKHMTINQATYQKIKVYLIAEYNQKNEE